MGKVVRKIGMVLGLLLAVCMCGSFAHAADKVGISGEKMTAPTDVKWNIDDPEHFGEGSWTPTTKNHWDWLLIVYRNNEEVYRQSIGNWCTSHELLYYAKKNGAMEKEGTYIFTVTPRDKSSAKSDECDVEGESATSDTLIYEKKSFEAGSLSWKDNTSTVTWTKPKYVGRMTLVLYKKGTDEDSIVYHCKVDKDDTSMDLTNYITSSGTYYCKLDNWSKLFLNDGSIVKTDDLSVDVKDLPQEIEGLQWQTGEKDIGCVTWNAPTAPSGRSYSYAVNLYKDGKKVITITADSNSADLYPYLTGDGKYSFSVQACYKGFEKIPGEESEKKEYQFNSNDVAKPEVQFTSDPETGTDSTVTWKAPAYVTNGEKGTYKVELYKGNDKVKTVTVKGNSVNFYDDMQVAGTGNYTCKVSGQMRDNAGVYGPAGQAETTYTYVDVRTGDFTVTGGIPGTDYTWDKTNNTLTILTSEALTISGKTTTGVIKIQQGKTANVTFDGVEITLEGTEYRTPLLIGDENGTGTTLNLTLKGKNVCQNNAKSDGGEKMKNTEKNSGIYVGKNILNINGSGSLRAVGGQMSYMSNAPGIFVPNGGTLNINSGTIEADFDKGTQSITSITGGAGIGTPGSGANTGSYVSPNAGTICINGGSITAVGANAGTLEGSDRNTGICIGCGSTDSSDEKKAMTLFSADNSWMIFKGETGYNNGSGPGTAVGDSTNKDLEKESTNSVVITHLDPNGSWSSNVYGNPTLKNCEPENPSGNTLRIEKGQTVTVGENTILTNNGTIIVEGTLRIATGGTLINNGTIKFGDKTGQVRLEETGQIISSGEVSQTTYPKKIQTTTKLSLQVWKDGNWQNIAGSVYPVYGDKVKLIAEVRNGEGNVQSDLSDSSYKFLINGKEVGASLSSGTASAEITLSGDAWKSWQIGKNTIKTKLSISKYKRSGIDWSINNTEAEGTINVRTTSLKISGTPTATGIFGDTLADIIPSGTVVLASNNAVEVKGSWSFQRIQNGSIVSEAFYPKVGDTAEYTAVFTPEDEALSDVISGDELTAEIAPKIEYLETPKSPYTLTGTYTDGTHVWVQRDDNSITVSPAKGYTMATEPFGTYENYKETTLKDIEEAKNSGNPIGFYLKDEEGHITNKIPLDNYVQKDSTASTVEIKISKDKSDDAASGSLKGYTSFTGNPAENGVFLNQSKTEEHDFTITAKDEAGSGESVASGVQEIRYCVIDWSDVAKPFSPEAVKELIEEDESNTDKEDKLSWLPYSQAVHLGRQGTYVMIAKVTDYLGNTSYVSTDGVVVYRDSDLQEESKSLKYTKTDKKTPTAVIDLRGNTLNQITVQSSEPSGGTATMLTKGTDYTVENNEDDTATVTFTKDWLDTVSAGEYTLTFSYNPQKLEFESGASIGDTPAESKATLKVIRATVTEDFFTVTLPEDTTYTNTGKEVTVEWKDDYKGIGNLSPVYYEKNGDDWKELDANAKPTEPGEYLVKVNVEITDTDNYSEVKELFADNSWTFTIEYLDTPDDSYTIDGDYTDEEEKIVWIQKGHEVTIKPAEGYTISESGTDEDDFEKSLTYADEHEKETIKIRLKDEKGHITDKITVVESIKVDEVNPTGKIKINVAGNLSYSSLQKKLSYNTFIKEGRNLSVSDKDEGSGIDTAQYASLSKEQTEKLNLTDSMSKAEIADAIEAAVKGEQGADAWKTYSAGVELSQGSQMIFVKLTDRVGNVTYLSTDGLYVYQESSINETELEYTRSSGKAPNFAMELKGNKLSAVTLKGDGDKQDEILNAGGAYTATSVDEKATIVFDIEWLQKNLFAREDAYTFSVKYLPLGAEVNDDSKGDIPDEIKIKITVRRHEVSASLFDFKAPANLTYTGGAKKATVTWKKDLTGTGEIIKMTYYGSDGKALKGEPSEPGTYTVKISVAEGDDYVAAKDITDKSWKFTITYPNTSEGPYTVTGDYTEEDTGVVWIRKGHEATITPAEGYQIYDAKRGTFVDHLTYKEAQAAGSIKTRLRSKAGYITGWITIEQEIKVDDGAPAGEVASEKYHDISSGQWTMKPAYDTFLREGNAFLVQASDEESGIGSVEYAFLSKEAAEKLTLTGDMSEAEIAEAIEAAVKAAGSGEDDPWTVYNKEAKITPKSGSQVVCVKISDRTGNATYFSTDGLYVYRDVEPSQKTLIYVRASGKTVSFTVKLHGNTLTKVALKKGGSLKTLKKGTDYTLTVSGDTAKITLKSVWLQSLPVGSYGLRLSYLALGEEFKPGRSIGDEPKPVELTLKSTAAKNQVLLAKAKSAGTSATLSWNKVKDADGYYIYAAKCNTSKKTYQLKKVKTIRSGSTTKYKYKGLKKNTWYKYQVVAYKKINGKAVTLGKSLTIHSMTGKSKTYADPTKVTASGKAVTLKKGKTAKLTAKVKSPKKIKRHTAKLRYVVSNTEIVSVSKTGKVKAKKKGTCTVYIVAQNGVYAKVKITVK